MTRLLRFSKPVLAGLALATAFLAVRASRLKVDFAMERLFESRSPDRLDYERARALFGGDDHLVFAAFETPDAFSPEAVALAGELREALAAQPAVRAAFGLDQALSLYAAFGVDPRPEVASNPLFRGTLFSADRKVTCLWVALKEDVRSPEARRAALAALAVPFRERGLDVRLAGYAVVDAEYIELTKRDLRTFMPIAAGVFLLLLALRFRNVAGTLLPLLVVAVGIVWTLGLMELAGFSLSLLSSLLPNMILILAIADVIHVLERYQEDLAEAPDRRAALGRTFRLMAAACFLTSFTTAVGFASLLTTDVPTIREFGGLTAAGIMIAYAVTLLLLGSALDLLPPFPARGARGRITDRLLGGIASVNERRPLLVAAAVAAAVALAAAGMLRLRRESSWTHDLRPANPVRRAHAFFDERLSGVFSIDLVLDGPARDLGWLRKVESFQAELARWRPSEQLYVRQAVGFVDVVKELHRARRGMKGPRELPSTPAELQAALALLRENEFGRMVDPAFSSCRVTLRVAGLTSRGIDLLERDLRALRARTPELAVTVTGKTWLAKRAMDRVVTNMLWSLGLASAVIFGSMALLFRSLRVGVLSILPNALPMLFTAGFMGWLGIDLSFSTVTIFSISLGIAVNTTIHYLARLRVEIALDGDPRAAMRRSIRGAGGPMVFSTTLLVLGFGAILTSNFVFTFHFGLLGGFALVTALLCDLFVTPALFMIFPPRVTPAAPRTQT